MVHLANSYLRKSLHMKAVAIVVLVCVISTMEALPCSMSKNKPCKPNGMPGILNVTRLYVYQRDYDPSAPLALREASGGKHKVLVIKCLRPGFMFAVQKLDYMGRNTTRLLGNGHPIRNDPNYTFVLEKRVRHVIRVSDFELVAGDYDLIDDNQNIMVNRMVAFYGERNRRR